MLSSPHILNNTDSFKTPRVITQKSFHFVQLIEQDQLQPDSQDGIWLKKQQTLACIFILNIFKPSGKFCKAKELAKTQS